MAGCCSTTKPDDTDFVTHSMLLSKKLRRTAVAIPARDEAERIQGCLEALDNQDGVRLDDIILLVNNTSDDTAAIARSVAIHASTKLHVIECHLAGVQANAGFARRLALQTAEKLVGERDILLTTDADGLVDPDWLSRNLEAIDLGADVVAGWVDLHPLEWGAIPTQLHEDDARECAYDALCDEIHGLLDADPADPLPRHTQHSGASIAVTAEAFARCGGVPAIASGEDRALIAALRRIDARVRHAPEVHVTVSGRTIGRAAGGMADTIRRRMNQPDHFLDDRLEPAADCVRRACARSGLRRIHSGNLSAAASLAGELGLSERALLQNVNQPYFGMAWEAIEAAAPLLRRRLVAVANLSNEMRAAQSVLESIRHEQTGTLAFSDLQNWIADEI